MGKRNDIDIGALTELVEKLRARVARLEREHEERTARDSAELVPLRLCGERFSWLPTQNRSRHCLVQWVRIGRLTRDGTRIRLRAVRVGHDFCTSAQWLREFWNQLADSDAERPAWSEAEGDAAVARDAIESLNLPFAGARRVG